MSGRGKKTAAPKKKANGYKMPAPIQNGEVIHDTIMKKKWRIGPSIGVGGFGEIYSACDHESSPKKGLQYPFVIKIEPHENGPLFVEKHFYVRNAQKEHISTFMKANKLTSLGMPTYFGNGSHEYKGEKYRYLVLERYGKDLWNIFKDNGRKFSPVTVFQIGLQMLDVLEYIHSRGYVHADIKGANILLGIKKGTENQAYLLDFGLATKLNDKVFTPDLKCAHNGTIEYTSRDAHLGVPTMRGDLEILGYNMLQWILGELPWEKNLKQPALVQQSKETFLKNVKMNIAKLGNVPDQLIKFFEYINLMKPKDTPDYRKLGQLFEEYLKSEGKTRNSKLEFSLAKKQKNDLNQSSVKDIIKKEIDNTAKVKRGRKPKIVKVEETVNSDSDNNENEPNSINDVVNKKVKRKSTEPAVVVRVKKVKLAPKPTPPVKKNHANIATQTSVEKLRRSPRQVSFDSPISKLIGEKRNFKLSKDSSANSSGDIFDDSFVIEEKKIKPKKRLLSDKEEIVKRVVKKKVTTTKPARSWKTSPAVLNGRSPPK